MGLPWGIRVIALGADPGVRRRSLVWGGRVVGGLSSNLENVALDLPLAEFAIVCTTHPASHLAGTTLRHEGESPYRRCLPSLKRRQRAPAIQRLIKTECLRVVVGNNIVIIG